MFTLLQICSNTRNVCFMGNHSVEELLILQLHNPPARKHNPQNLSDFLPVFPARLLFGCLSPFFQHMIRSAIKSAHYAGKAGSFVANALLKSPLKMRVRVFFRQEKIVASFKLLPFFAGNKSGDMFFADFRHKVTCE